LLGEGLYLCYLHELLGHANISLPLDLNLCEQQKASELKVPFDKLMKGREEMAWDRQKR